MSFDQAQAGLYNAMLEGLGLSGDTFQIIQPTPPLVAGNDQFLWNFFNNIPPQSNTQNFILSGGNQLFNNYKAIIDALEPGEKVDIQGDIGQQNYNDFVAYLKANFAPLPPPNQYPDIFFNWAFLNAPDVADIGAADYETILLDPIRTAAAALTPYLPTTGPHATPGLPPDWALGYAALVAQLANAPIAAFSVDSETMNSDLSTTWTGGEDSGFFGLWGGSDATSSQSAQFSESHFRVDASFAHVLQFQTNAGAWYTSSTLGEAFGNQGSPPWRPPSESVRQWENTFGADGDTRFVLTSLVVVDTMQVTVSANTAFSAEDRQIIQNNSSEGLWPFASSSSSGGSATTVTFDDSGGITIRAATLPGVPMVIGGNVLSIGRFLGHAVTAMERRAAMLRG